MSPTLCLPVGYTVTLATSANIRPMGGLGGFDTLLLRFRDLATNPGETIESHAEICAKRGKTLWGWWHKGFEKLLLAAFERVRALARPGARGRLRIYLFNAHERKFYEATTREVHFKSPGIEITSPEPRLTPEYYRQRKCLAWFELLNINKAELEAKELPSLYHVAISSLFRSRRRAIEFAHLNGKPLGEDAERIEAQSRTIWFLKADPRPRAAARDRAVGRAPRARVARRSPRPAIDGFPKAEYELKENRLLWLSDLHFSKATGAGAPHAFAYQDASGSHGRETLQHKIRRVVEVHSKGDVGAVIVSGDLSWAAERKEFDLARGFLGEIAGTSGRADPYKLALCPGNHDLKFSRDPSNRYAEVKDTTPTSRAAFARFYKDLYGVLPNRFLSMGRHYRLANGARVDVVCLNSSLLQQVPDKRKGGKHVARFQGHGLVGTQQLEDAANKMAWKSDRHRFSDDVIRIAVVHHHLLPVLDYLDPEIGASYSTLLDADRLASWLVSKHVDMLLHGHMHEPFIAYVRRGILAKDKDGDYHRFAVCGMGSTGVSRAHRRDGTPNIAAVLDIEPKRIQLTMYSFTADRDSPEEHLRWRIPIRG